jgi:hypothetical protein
VKQILCVLAVLTMAALWFGVGIKFAEIKRVPVPGPTYIVKPESKEMIRLLEWYEYHYEALKAPIYKINGDLKTYIEADQATKIGDKLYFYNFTVKEFLGMKLDREMSAREGVYNLVTKKMTAKGNVKGKSYGLKLSDK